jgi:spore maturation protein SpmB
VNVYESFIEGAKDGFSISIKIIPYLIAILVAVGMFRASGAMEATIGTDVFYSFFLLAYPELRFKELQTQLFIF